MAFEMQTENQAYANLLCNHLRSLTQGLRTLPSDKWDWTPDPAAPTARILAAHTWQWLQCDRQHIAERNPALHSRIPEPPSEPEAMCDALQDETERWERLILELTPEQFAEERHQFSSSALLNIRWFVCHMIQNSIYKHGQFSTLYFALGLDGTEPYTAPFPNPIYEECYGSDSERNGARQR